MNKYLLIPALLCLMATACERPSEPAATEAGHPAATAAKPAPSRSAGSAVLADDYVPSFKHKIRSQRHVASGAKYRHVVIVEYMNADAAAVVQTLRSDLAAAGFAVSEPVPHGTGVRLAAKGKSGAVLTSDVYGPDQLKLVNRDARGIVYFAWTDRKPR